MRILFLSIIVILIGLIGSLGYAEELEPEIITITETIIEYETIVEMKYVEVIKEIIVNQTEPMVMEATAYTAGYESTGKHPGHPAYGITFSGKQVERGMCAADLDLFPLGTTFFVEGYGRCIVEDKGSAIKGLSVDVFIPNLEEALEFGREDRKVWILSDYGE